MKAYKKIIVTTAVVLACGNALGQKLLTKDEFAKQDKYYVDTAAYGKFYRTLNDNTVAAFTAPKNSGKVRADTSQAQNASKPETKTQPMNSPPDAKQLKTNELDALDIEMGNANLGDSAVAEKFRGKLAALENDPIIAGDSKLKMTLALVKMAFERAVNVAPVKVNEAEIIPEEAKNGSGAPPIKMDSAANSTVNIPNATETAVIPAPIVVTQPDATNAQAANKVQEKTNELDSLDIEMGNANLGDSVVAGKFRMKLEALSQDTVVLGNETLKATLDMLNRAWERLTGTKIGAQAEPNKTETIEKPLLGQNSGSSCKSNIQMTALDSAFAEIGNEYDAFQQGGAAPSNSAVKEQADRLLNIVGGMGAVEGDNLSRIVALANMLVSMSDYETCRGLGKYISPMLKQ